MRVKKLNKTLRSFFVKVIAVVLLLSISFSYFYFSAKKVAAAWYSDNWKYRMQLTIDHTKVSGSSNLSSFPVLVSFTNISLKKAQSSGNDILFTSGDGSTKLDHEIESFDSSTGKIVAWVRIPTLSYQTDTPIYLYYGNQFVSSQQNKTGVWDTNYAGVWHLGETSGHQKNSTSTVSIDSTVETTTQQGTAVGIANGADEFGASNNVVKIPDSSLLRQNGDMTVETWVYLRSQAGRPIYKSAGASPWASYEIWFKGASDSNRVQFIWYNNSGTPFSRATNTSLQTGAWYHIVGVKSGTNVIIYLNGVDDHSGASPTTSGTIFNTSAAQLAFGNTAAANSPVDGFEDEVRYSNVARSPDWIKTSFNTVSSPNTFFKNKGIEEKARQPVLYFKFDEGTGTAPADSSINGNTGAFNGTNITWQTANACVFGKCVGFGGTGSVNVANTVPNINTVSFWVRPTTNGESILDLDGGSYTIAASNGTLSATGFTSYYVNGIANGVLTANVWQHIEAISTTPFSANAITIGKITSIYFNGFIDEFKLYDYVRAPSQIKSDAVQGAGPAGSSAVLGKQSTTALNQALVGYWKMDEGHDAVAHNSGSGKSAYDATLSASNWSNQGKYGKAMNLNGTSDYAYITGGPNMQGWDGLTVSTWIYPSSSGTYSTQYILSKSNTADSGWGSTTFWLKRDTTNQHIYFGARPYNDYSAIEIESGALSQNTWHQIVGTWDGISNKSKLYIDGRFVSETTTAGNSYLGNLQTFTIGRAAAGSPASTYFSGKIDEVKVFNVALAADQVKVEYNQGRTIMLGAFSDTSKITGTPIPINSSNAAYCVPGSSDICAPPVGEWKLDENKGTTVYDTSGNGYNSSSWTGGPRWGIGCKSGGCIGTTINSIQDVITITNPPKLNFSSGLVDYTASIWVKISSAQATSLVLYKGGSSGTADGWDIEVKTSGYANCNYADHVAGGPDKVQGTSYLVDNKWHYITCEMDRTGRATGTAGLHIFVDGILENSNTTLTESTYASHTRNLQIGEYSTSYETSGLYDNVIVYDYARTPAQVAWDYNRGAPIAWYKFDECQGNIVHSSSYTTLGSLADFNGTIHWDTGRTTGTCNSGVGTEMWGTAAGKYGGALSFNGVGDYVQISDNPALRPRNGSWSISTWAKPQNIDQSNIFLNKIQFAGAGTNYTMGFASDTNYNVAGQHFVCTFTQDTSSIYRSAHSNADVIDGNWHMYSCVIDKVSDRAHLFVDGVEVSVTHYEAGAWPTINNTDNLIFGGVPPAGGFYNGQLDDIQLYPYALTIQQIQLIYNQRSTVRFGP